MDIHANRKAVEELNSLYAEMNGYKIEPPKEKLKTDRNMFNIPKSEQDAARERIKAKTAAKRAKMSEGVRDEDPEKGTKERKARLEKKRGMKLDDHPQYQKEGYGAPGHNPGSGEKSVARAKALMDRQGKKGAPGLDAMAAAKKEHEAKRGVKKEEMSPQEVQLQKKKATLDKMIAMKRKQQLDKSKAEPTKAMGEAKELSVDDQMKISRDYNRKSPEEKRAANAKVLGAIKKVKREKDTRTDAQKMTDATGPRPGSRYRGD